MGDFTQSTSIDAGPDELFAYLADVNNLPSYFSRMTSAAPGDGDEVHTTAQLPDGNRVEGDAWFRVDDTARRIEWGSEGPNDYHGYLDVTPTDTGSSVEVHLHTSRVDDGESEVEVELRKTLDAIKQQVPGA